MAKKFTSLPSQAGRAYAALLSDQHGSPNRMIQDHKAKQTSLVSFGKHHRSLQVLPVSRVKPDAQLIARILMELANETTGSATLDSGSA